METFFTFICAHADSSHYIFLGLLFLAGLNVPISEDLLLLTAGALVSRCIPDDYWFLYFWMFIGCWLSGSQAYWLGRLLGPKLYKIKWFHRAVSPEKITKLHTYYEKFGIFTFIVGRFIPGGVRNALFITAGLGKMYYPLFVFRDFFATLISTSVLFYIGFVFGENYELLVEWFMTYNRTALAIIVLVLISLLIYAKVRSKSHDHIP